MNRTPITPENPFGLTEVQRRFVAEYVIDLDAAAAAVRVGASTNTASKWLIKPQISAAIHAAMQERRAIVEKLLKGAKLDAERVLLEIARVALSDIRGLFDANNALLPPEQWPDELAAAVAKLEVLEVTQYDPETKEKVVVGHLKKVALWDKNSALDKAMRHLGGYEKDNEQRRALEDTATPQLKRVMSILASRLNASKAVDND